MAFKLSTRGIVFSACFGALLALSSFLNLNLGFSPVPISLENWVVMMAGAVLGPVYGFFSMAIVIVLAALGFPLFEGQGGLAVLTGPTGGFLWMYPLAAFCIGFISRFIKGKGKTSFLLMFLVMEGFGSLLLYVSGVPWLAHASGLSFPKAMAAGCYPYLPGDAIKALIAASIALTVRRVFPAYRITGALPSDRFRSGL